MLQQFTHYRSANTPAPAPFQNNDVLEPGVRGSVGYRPAHADSFSSCWVNRDDEREAAFYQRPYSGRVIALQPPAARFVQFDNLVFRPAFNRTYIEF
jgi:hypothetical protein